MKLAFVIAVPVFLWLATLLSQPSVSAGTAEPKQRISVDEIGRSILLVGRLGEPLGEKMELSGYWHFPKTPHPKDDSIRFSVSRHDGQEAFSQASL